MSSLTYQGVTLQLDRTTAFLMEPVYSEDGVDYLYTHIRLEVTCVFNPYATASNIFAGRGDTIGLSIKNLLESTLMKPRGILQFQIGNDLTVVAPQTDLPVVSGQVLQQDCNQGPHPLYARVNQITGDFTAIVSFGIECWISACGNVVLSNRWNVTADTDREAMTTLHTTGIAVLRSDLAAALSFTPDDFRAGYFPQCPTQFQREHIRVSVSSDGTTCRYDIIDKQQALALGAISSSSGSPFSNITHIEGGVTAGTSNPTGPLVREMLENAANLPNWQAYGFLPLLGLRMLARSSIPVIFTTRSKASCLVRVYGNINARKEDMAKVAVAVAAERLLGFKSTTSFSIYSSMLTQSIEQRMVELQVDAFISISTIALSSTNAFQFSTLMNLTNSITLNYNGVTGLLKDGSTGNLGTCPPQPGTNPQFNDRGTWTGRLITQALGVSCEVPANPPTTQQLNVQTPDTSAMV